MEASKLRDAAEYSFRDRRSAFYTLSISALLLAFMALSSNPRYSFQLIESGLVLQAVYQRLVGIGITSGVLGIILTIIYSLVGGISAVNMYGNLSTSGFRTESLAGALPALAGGCAGCGTGLLAFAGATGAAALMPFSGNLVRLAGIALLLVFLARSGDPRKCEM